MQQGTDGSAGGGERNRLRKRRILVFIVFLVCGSVQIRRGIEITGPIVAISEGSESSLHFQMRGSSSVSKNQARKTIQESSSFGSGHASSVTMAAMPNITEQNKGQKRTAQVSSSTIVADRDAGLLAVDTGQPQREKQHTNGRGSTATGENGASDTLVELPTYTNITMNLPTPILVASLPKSGTVSIWRYFLCGGQKASHLYAKLNGTVDFDPPSPSGVSPLLKKKKITSKTQPKQMISGQCMRRNYVSKRPLLHGCGDYDIWSDTGFIKIPPTPNHCYYPSIHGLDAWYESYPYSTILLVKRDALTWSKSIQKWGGGSLLKRWKVCNIPGFLPSSNDGDENARRVAEYNSIENLQRFYNWHVNLVRNFTKFHPTITYIEASLEDPQIGNILSQVTGIPSICWAKCNPTTDTQSCVAHST